MVELAEANSRMKDFYDVHHLIGDKKHDPLILESAIKATFLNRQTGFVKNHSLFDTVFAKDKTRLERWNAFLKKSKLDPLEFSEAHRTVVEHLKPIYERL